MSQLIQLAAAKLPTMLGAGILSISIVGIAAAAVGFTMSVGIELFSAGVGMAVGSRYA